MSENNKKIKSITIKKDSPLSQIIILAAENNPETLGIEYKEPEQPKLLKRADGSLISEPEEGDEILIIEDGGLLTKYTVLGDFMNVVGEGNREFVKRKYKKSDITSLRKGHIFLPEGVEIAKKKAKMLTKQLEIQYEIDRLNAEEGSKEWKDYTLIINPLTDKVFGLKTSQNGQVRMSKETSETILEKYSQDELKQYLEIII